MLYMVTWIPSIYPSHVSIHGMNIDQHSIPEDPCMEYLPTLTPKVIQNNPNVGKYSIHGSYGYCKTPGVSQNRDS